MSAEVVPVRLVELEAVIERGLATFVEVGSALMEIREGRLYRETHGTFEAYCRDRWGFTDRHARRLMDAAEVAGQIETGPIGPVNEAQARELAPVLRESGPERAAEVYREAVERTDGRPTARVIRQVVAEVIEEVSEPVARPEPPSTDPTPMLAILRALDAVGAAREFTAAQIAEAIAPKDRTRWWRDLRRAGTFLGSVALLLEGERR